MKTRKVISAILIFCLCFTFLSCEVFGAENINISISKQPKIDIVLATGQTDKTQLDMTNFERDLRTALKGLGVDDTEISKIETVETVDNSLSSTDYDIDTVLNSWQKVGANVWSSSGGTLFCKLPGGGSMGAGSWQGTALLDGDSYGTQDVTIDVTVDAASAQLMEGICWRVTKNSDGTYNGYFLNFGAHGYKHQPGVAYGATVRDGISLMKFSHMSLVDAFDKSDMGELIWCGYTGPSHTGHTVSTSNYGHSASVTYLAGYEYLLTGKVKVVVTGNNMKVYFNNALIMNVNDSSYPEGTYGFWGNNCEMTAGMKISTIGITSKKIIKKSFNDVLAIPSWNDKSIRAIINVNDYIEEDFNDNNKLAAILSRCANEQIHYISWGPSTTKTSNENFIKQNNNRGTYIQVENKNTYSSAVQQTAIYIKSLLDSQKYQGNEYVLMNQDIALNVTPVSYKQNTQTTDYPSGRWLINHDNTFFANPNGQYEKSGVYQPNMDVTSFDKVGKYEILFEKDLIKRIYIHRMPTAAFTPTLNGVVPAFRTNSFDLDSNNDSKGFGPGIVQEEWKYKLSNESNWKNGKPSTIEPGKSYLIQLRVLDEQGQWSEPVTKYLSGSSEYVNPVADFNFSSPQISKYINNFSITNSSYDPKSLPLNYYHWKVVKDGKTTLYEGGNSSFFVPSIDFQAKGTGTYAYTLYVQNSANLKSDEYTKFLTVVEDTQKPDIEINPQNGNWASNISSHNITVKLTDTDSKLLRYRYAITTTSIQPAQNASNWTGLVNYGNNISTATQQINISNQGTYYVHVEATDRAGNKIVVSRGPYKIDTGKPGVEFIKIEDLQEYLPEYKP